MKKRLAIFGTVLLLCLLALLVLTAAAPAKHARAMSTTCLSGITHEDAFFTPMAARVTVRLNGVIKTTVQSQGNGDYTACWQQPQGCLGPDHLYSVTAVEADGGDQSYGVASYHVNDGCIRFSANVHAPDGGGG